MLVWGKTGNELRAYQFVVLLKEWLYYWVALGINVIMPAWCCSCTNKSCLNQRCPRNHLPVSASTALVIFNPDKLPLDNESWLHFYTRTTSISSLEITYPFSLIWLCHLLTVRFCHLISYLWFLRTRRHEKGIRLQSVRI